MFRRPACAVKGHVFPGDKRGTLYHHQLIDSVSQAFGQEGGIILNSLRECHLLQPNAGENVSLLQNQQGMQADCLQARRIEQSQIEAGPHLLL